MNIHPLHQRLHQFGALALAVLCFVQTARAAESEVEEPAVHELEMIHEPEVQEPEKTGEAKPLLFDFGATNSEIGRAHV